MGGPEGGSPPAGGSRRPVPPMPPAAELRPRRAGVPEAPPEVRTRRIAGQPDPSDPAANGLRPNVDYRRTVTMGEGGGFTFFSVIETSPKKDEARNFFDSARDANSQPLFSHVNYDGKAGYVLASEYGLFTALQRDRLGQITGNR